jgi:tartronate-semialdehyde synthase
VNNAYLGLIRQSQRGFDMDYHVQLAFDNINTEPGTDPGSDVIKGYGVDHVKLAEAMGAKALRVTDPEELLPALETAKKMLVEHRVPVVVEVVLERVTNISMGVEIDNVVEFEELALTSADAPTAIISMLD